MDEIDEDAECIIDSEVIDFQSSIDKDIINNHQSY
jgi:hypothetical protein